MYMVYIVCNLHIHTSISKKQFHIFPPISFLIKRLFCITKLVFNNNSGPRLITEGSKQNTESGQFPPTKNASDSANLTNEELRIVRFRASCFIQLFPFYSHLEYLPQQERMLRILITFFRSLHRR